MWLFAERERAWSYSNFHIFAIRLRGYYYWPCSKRCMVFPMKYSALSRNVPSARMVLSRVFFFLFLSFSSPGPADWYSRILRCDRTQPVENLIFGYKFCFCIPAHIINGRDIARNMSRFRETRFTKLHRVSDIIRTPLICRTLSLFLSSWTKYYVQLCQTPTCIFEISIMENWQAIQVRPKMESHSKWDQLTNLLAHGERGV